MKDNDTYTTKNIVNDSLTEFLKESAQKILKVAIEEEVEQFILSYSDRLLDSGHKRIVRNGYLPARDIQTGIGKISVQVPRVRDRGWGKKNKRLKAKTSGKYYQRTNIIAGYVNNRAIAPMLFNGSCNIEIFNSWVKEFLIKELVPGQFIIMDNASFHKSSTTRELIASVGCKIIYLPPYSPDLNPIEKFWANMKRWIKAHI